MAAQGATLPEYIQREFGDYLKCDRLEYGFLRVRCTDFTASGWSRSAASAGLLPELRGPAYGRERGVAGGGHISRSSHAAVGAELPERVVSGLAQPYCSLSEVIWMLSCYFIWVESLQLQ